MRITTIVGVTTFLASLAPAIAQADGFEEQQHASVRRHEHHVARTQHARVEVCGHRTRTGSWEQWFGTYEGGSQPVITDREIAERYCWAYNGREPDFAAQVAQADRVIQAAEGAATACSLCVGRSATAATSCGPHTVGAKDSELQSPFVSVYDAQGNLHVADQTQRSGVQVGQMNVPEMNVEQTGAAVLPPDVGYGTQGSVGGGFAGGQIQDGMAGGQVGHGAAGLDVGSEGAGVEFGQGAVGAQVGGHGAGIQLGSWHAGFGDQGANARVQTNNAQGTTCGAVECGANVHVGSPPESVSACSTRHAVDSGTSASCSACGSPVGAYQPDSEVSASIGADVDADGIPDVDDVDIGNDGVVDALEEIG